MSGFEIITITFSFIVGLGVAQVLRSVAFVIRERSDTRLHWLPFVVAGIVLFFQVQFWFGLARVNALIEEWAWPIYGMMLFLAVVIFLAGATVLPPPNQIHERDLIDDFDSRGRISLPLTAAYLLGWIGVAIMFWTPEFWHLVAVNGLMAAVLVATYGVRNPLYRNALCLVLIAMAIYGSMTVWTTPNLQMPYWQGG